MSCNSSMVDPLLVSLSQALYISESLLSDETEPDLACRPDPIALAITSRHGQAAVSMPGARAPAQPPGGQAPAGTRAATPARSRSASRWVRDSCYQKRALHIGAPLTSL